MYVLSVAVVFYLMLPTTSNSNQKKQGHEPYDRNRGAGKRNGGITISKEDFDFQGALAEFEKDAEMAKLVIRDEELEPGQEVSNEEGDGDASEDQSVPTIVVKKYDKNSFFDEVGWVIQFYVITLHWCKSKCIVFEFSLR